MSAGQPYEGQRFASFDALKKYLDEYGRRNYVRYWTRSSHTISSLKSKSKRFNPALKYACMKFACIFGGEKTRCRGAGIRKSTTYRNLGCPFTINAVVGEDGNHVKLETVILEHNHSLGKSLYNSLKNSKNKMKILQDEIDNNGGNQPAAAESDQPSPPASPAEEPLNLNEFQLFLPNGMNKGVIKTKRTANARVAVLPGFQQYAGEIHDKCGSTSVKVFVVGSQNPEGQDAEDVEQQMYIQELDENQLANLRRQIDRSERRRYLTFSQICRLCLSNTNELRPIFDESKPLESTMLSFKIMSCASIDVGKDDGLPGNICTACEEQLEVAYNFRIRAENADTSLRQPIPVKEYVHVNEAPLLNADDLEEFEPCEQEEAQDVDEPEEQMVIESPIPTQENVYLDPTQNIIFDEEHQVYAQFEDSCPICGCKFGTYTNMLQHLEEHKDIGNFLLACNFCSSVFSNVKTLIEHLNGHMAAMAAGDGINENIENETVQEGQATYGETEQVEEPPVPESKPQRTTDTGYLCNVCGKLLKSKDRFQSHKNAHEGLKPHVCAKCGRGFADRKNMHQHYDIVHLKKAKHECPICHKKFYAPTKMKSHLTMHYDIKPYTCDICGKTFRLRMNMVKHKKTHSNDRPHKCDKCKAAFIDKNLLTRHSYVHGGIRPHACAQCGHRFTLKFNLKRHLESGKCHGRMGAGGFAWGRETAGAASLAGKSDYDGQNNLVDEIMQQLGAK